MWYKFGHVTFKDLSQSNPCGQVDRAQLRAALDARGHQIPHQNHTVEYDASIKSQLASRNQLSGLIWPRCVQRFEPTQPVWPGGPGAALGRRGARGHRAPFSGHVASRDRGESRDRGGGGPPQDVCAMGRAGASPCGTLYPVRDERGRHGQIQGRFREARPERYMRFASYMERSSAIVECDPGILTSPCQMSLARFLMSTLHRAWTLAWIR